MDGSIPGFPVLHYLRVYSNSCPLSWWYHLIPCCSLLLLPSMFPSIGVFSNESALRFRCHLKWIWEPRKEYVDYFVKTCTPYWWTAVSEIPPKAKLIPPFCLPPKFPCTCLYHRTIILITFLSQFTSIGYEFFECNDLIFNHFSR